MWEAKNDDLAAEIKRKAKAGYPLTNIPFQSPSRAVLYQNDLVALDCDLAKPENLVELLRFFFEYRQPYHLVWEDAVQKFAERIPELAKGVTTILEAEHKQNADFRDKFSAFAELCRSSINPDLPDDAIRKMLVQHLLTERIFRKVFSNQEFLSRNVIAAEIEKVIRSITARHFSRDAFLKDLDHFYVAIEKAAEAQTGYTEKQQFLNTVYEKFFQSFDKKQADTHGIVYTPQPIVDFMVRSVEEVLQSEFGKSLSDPGVHILDPFTGTGTFITRIIQQIKRSALPQKYAEELHCNEIMLLPYYIASMNIEHAYMEQMGEYRPFEGICLVDTFETLGQSSFFNSANTERVTRQAQTPIRIVVGNPPYNMGQASEENQNRNRKYTKLGQVDNRIAKTYTKDSSATLKNKLGDPYVKAFRWASDRIKESGIVCLVSNNSFLSGLAFDGMRRHLAQDFTSILHLNCKGNANTAGERRRREGGNVFNDQIKVSVGITILVKNPDRNKCVIKIYSLDDHLRAKHKIALLEKYQSFDGSPLKVVLPDVAYSWIEPDDEGSFRNLTDLVGDSGIFCLSAPGVNTARDAYLANFSEASLSNSVEAMKNAYLRTLNHYFVERPKDVESFTDNHDPHIKWSPLLWRRLKKLAKPSSSSLKITTFQYRPFTSYRLWQDPFWIERPGILAKYLSREGFENRMISLTAGGVTSGFFISASAFPVDFHFTGDSQCFPFYTHDKDGTNRQENITDWALTQYQTHYNDLSITKWDIFHSTYALLHHPEYRTRYAANLKRELPRIPFPPDLHAFAQAGKRLMELHINYEQQPEYPLEEVDNREVPFTLRVERMRLNKDRTELRYNEALTLRGIPPEVYEYRLGNRSALEWIIDQYRVTTDARSGILNDPNRPEDERYILRLIRQVVTVSLETQQIIAALPSLNFPATIPTSQEESTS